MKDRNERNSIIDIMKAIMILCVVIYHLIYRKQNGMMDMLIKESIYVSIPLFVLIAGYFYREGNGSIIMDVAKRMKKLVLPPIFIDAILLLIGGPYFMLVHGYGVKDWAYDSLMTYLRPELMSRLVPDYVGGDLFNNLSPVWFIWALAFSTIEFIIVMRIIRGKKEEADITSLVISMIIFMIIGSILFVYSPALSWSLHVTPMYAGIMIMGVLIRRCQVPEKLEKMNLVLSGVIMIILWVLHFIIFKHFGSDCLYLSNFGSAGFISSAFLIIEVLMGGFILFTIARFISLCSPLKNAFSWIGRHTLVILLVHCFSAGIVVDILHTYNKPGPNWYVEPLTSEIVIKSVISFLVATIGSIGLAALNDRIKMKFSKK